VTGLKVVERCRESRGSKKKSVWDYWWVEEEQMLTMGWDSWSTLGLMMG
jgi:hypothetical protein